MILLIYSIIIILSALTDALFFQGEKALSKLVETILTAGIISVPFIYKIHLNKRLKIEYFVAIGVMYICLRISLFDFVFNVASGLPVNHTGTTTFIWDALLSYLKSWQFWVMRGFFFTLAWLVWTHKLR